MRLDGLEIFLRVNRGRALDENVERIRRDDVVLVGGSEDVVAGIVINNLRFGVVQHVVILLREISRGSWRNHRFDFANCDFFDAGISGERSGGDTRAKSNSKHGNGMRMQQCRQMADHSLQFHVEGFGGRFDVAIHVHFHRAVVPLCDCNRRIYSFDRI